MDESFTPLDTPKKFSGTSVFHENGKTNDSDLSKMGKKCEKRLRSNDECEKEENIEVDWDLPKMGKK